MERQVTYDPDLCDRVKGHGSLFTSWELNFTFYQDLCKVITKKKGEAPIYFVFKHSFGTWKVQGITKETVRLIAKC